METCPNLIQDTNFNHQVQAEKEVVFVPFLQAAFYLYLSAELLSSMKGSLDKKDKIVIIGGGLMGSAAAWQLAKEGNQVILLEQQSEEYTSGSSFGEARICRSLGPKHDIWSFLHKKSVAEAHELIEYLKKADNSSHKMEDIYSDSPVTYLLHTEKKNVVERMLKQQEDPYESSFTQEQASSLFGMDVCHDEIVIKEEQQYTGTVNPKVLLSKLRIGIEKKGGEILYSTCAKDIKRTEDGYEIEIKTSKDLHEIWKVDRIILAAGPYTPHLLKGVSLQVSEEITPKRVFLAFLKINNKTYHRLDSSSQKKLIRSFPLIDLSDEHVFAMIEKIDEDGIPVFKIGGHFLRNEIDDLDKVWSQELDQKEIDWSKEAFRSYLDKNRIKIDIDDINFKSGYSCVYSLTDDEIPIVSPIIDNSGTKDPNFIVIGGLSGVGAKGALTYGLIATNLLLSRNEDSFMYKKTAHSLTF